MSPRLRLLLASSSLAAMVAGGGAPAFAVGICGTNFFNGASVGAVTNSSPHTCIYVVNSTIAGNVSNTSTLTTKSPSKTGITINNSTIHGAISNSGAIHASQIGIFVNNNAAVSGGISNSGALSAGSDGIIISNLTTFSGGLTNSGTLSAGGVGVFVSTVSSFAGGVTNSGTLSAGGAGIFLGSVLSFADGIANNGTLSAGADGILVFVSTFAGGIANSGQLSAGEQGIVVQFATTFAGGISNSGSILPGIGSGIIVNSVSAFSSGIANSGTISSRADAIDLNFISAFAGGISNSGTLSGGASGIIVNQVSAFSGGIANSGTVSGHADAINLSFISVFAGGISNSGTLSGGGSGILLSNVTTFSGGITNSGTISAADDGIRVLTGSSFAGGISNSRAISAGGVGIQVQSVSNFSGGISNSGALSAGSAGIIISNLTTFSGGLANSGTLSARGVGVFVSTVSSFTGGVTNSGTLSAGGGGIFLGPVLSFADGIANNGTLSAGADGILVLVSSFAGGIANRGQLSAGEQGIVVQFATTFAGGITNSGSILPGIGSGIAVNGLSAFSGGIANSGTISGRADAINLNFISIFAGGISNSGTLIGNTGIALGLNVSTFSGAIVNSGNITGTGGTAINVSNGPPGITIDQQAGTVTGAINLSANDTVNVGGGVINGNILGGGAGDTINFALGSGTFTYGAAHHFTNIGAVNVTSGTVILDGQNAATTTNVTGGNLQIGDAASSGAQLVSTVDVDGGILSGHGTILGGVTVNAGGTLAPGGSIGTLTVAGGPLTFAAGSTYSIQISDTAASKTLVSGAPGTVTINGGTVVVTPQYTLGTHGGTTFTILTASGGRSGQFSPVVANVPNFTGALSLSYDADDVFLNVGKGYELLPQAPGGNANQSQVVTGINGAIMTGVTVPANFQTLQTLSGPAYLTALTQLGGEVATGANVSASQLTGEFLNLMLDPFVDGRGGNPGSSGGALGFAPDQQASLPPDAALAYAGVLKAPAASASGGGLGFNQRWSTWASGFGGSATTNGNAAVGSNNVTTGTYGYAAGMDYRTSPDTVLGFALAGGGTNWNLANALGTGRSDSFLAGVYGVTHNGPWYFAGALSFANNWFTTNRTAMSDQLTAKFQGQNYAARLEGGYRFAVPVYHGAGGVTPYAAIQAQDFHTPAYSETDVTGGGFGLSYNAMNGTDARSELGSRFDDLTALDNMPLVLRARVAWAHDWVSNPALTAAFETLPGSSFTVNGAPVPRDSALTSAGAQLFFTPHWSLLAKFDGQFAGGSQLYAGTGTLRYTW